MNRISSKSWGEKVEHGWRGQASDVLLVCNMTSIGPATNQAKRDKIQSRSFKVQNFLRQQGQGRLLVNKNSSCHYSQVESIIIRFFKSLVINLIPKKIGYKRTTQKRISLSRPTRESEKVFLFKKFENEETKENRD